MKEDSVNINIKENERYQMSETEKSIMFLALCLLAFLDFAGYGLPITLYPQLAAKIGLSSTFVGIVFALFPFGGFFAPLLTGKFMRFYRKDLLLTSFLFITGASKVLFGILYYIENVWIFMVISIISRFVWGFSFSAFMTICFSLIPEIWPDQVVQKISYFEFALNCGLMAGPLMGSLISYFLNFFWVFMIFTIFNWGLGLISIFKFLKIKAIKQFGNENKPLKIMKILTSSSLIIQFFFQSLFLGSIMFTYPGFQNKIIDGFKSTQGMVSAIYALNMIGYCIALIIFNKIYKSTDSRKKWFFRGSIMMIIFNNLIGPNPLLGIKSENGGIICMSIAFFFIGVSQSTIITLLIPEYKDILKTIYPNDPEELLIDLSPSLFSVSYSFAEFANCIVGGIVVDEMGFDWASAVYSLVLILYFVIYWTKQYFSKTEYIKMEEEKVDITEVK